MLCFFFLLVQLYFLIPAVIPQVFSPAAEIITPRVITTKEAKAEIEIHLVTVKAKVRRSYNSTP